MYFDRELAAWVLMGVMIGLALGYIIGFYIPIPGATHLRTVTIVNSTTVTIPINITKTVTYVSTTTVGGKVVTVTMTTTYIMPTTTTSIVNNTVTKIIVVPVTNTTTKTVTSTSTTTLPYTLTVTTTVVENASVLPPLNLTNLNDTITWMRTDYALGMMTLANLSLPLGYCLATMWVFPNASITIVGAWIAPVGAIQQALNNSLVAPVLAYTFPRTGVNEYQFYPPQVVWINPQSFMVSTAGFNGAWALSITGYPWSGYTVVAMASMHPSYVDWAFRYLNNGTYLMIFAWPWQVPEGAIQLLANPPGLCLVQVIRVKPGTPDSYILNMTYLGAQYVAWAFTEAAWGKPAPCYWSPLWTYGGWVYDINNPNSTKPIGSNWDYYCGPKGVWLPMKP
jgi:hypothetical protein